MTSRGPQKLQPTMTPNRLHYLRQCERLGPYEPRHGVTANHCLRLGWVQTMIRLKDGAVIPFTSWRDLPLVDRVMADYEFLGQSLTDAGREALDKVVPNRSKPQNDGGKERK